MLLNFQAKKHNFAWISGFLPSSQNIQDNAQAVVSRAAMIMFRDISCLNLREPHHTPRAYPMNPQTPKWKEFL